MRETKGLADLIALLPGYNCGECGFRRCADFAAALVEGTIGSEECPFMQQNAFRGRGVQIAELLPKIVSERGEPIVGVIDHLTADFALAPLPGEPSCREDLHPFDSAVHIETGDILRYRPLGCPITHFARVIAEGHGVVTVHMIGPRHRLGGEDDFKYQEIGICLVLAFEGVVVRGRVPDVSETVRFLPEHCMMQKVHSGVIVHSEGDRVRIESIDLKVW